MGVFASLSRQQKEAVGLLQIGTFLEYFDLMLYVHMAILLNELFFPKTDLQTAALLSALAFSSTYVLRPIGALIFGYIGDNVGRKATVVLTTIMMAVSCIVMANLPTYAQVGISAAWIVTICRIVQGLSSMGEIVGAEIYLTETIKVPLRYPVVGLMGCAAAVGSLFALFIASIATTSGFNWRIAFWIGACVAVVGSIARTRLRETPEFVDAQKLRQKANECIVGKSPKSSVSKEKIAKKTIVACFLIQSGFPISFFFAYIYCGDILKNHFCYTAEQVIHNNLSVAIMELLGFLVCVFLSCRIHPLKILKAKAFILLPIVFLLPFILNSINNPSYLLLVQLICMFLSLTDIPASAVYYKYFPTLKRFTYTVFIFALSRAVMYTITSFILIYLTSKFGYWGLQFVMFPVIFGFLWGVNYFEKLENLNQNKPQVGTPLSTEHNQIKLAG
jgi:MFS family permease